MVSHLKYQAPIVSSIHFPHFNSECVITLLCSLCGRKGYYRCYRNSEKICLYCQSFRMRIILLFVSVRMWNVGVGVMLLVVRQNGKLQTSQLYCNDGILTIYSISITIKKTTRIYISFCPELLELIMIRIIGICQTYIWENFLHRLSPNYVSNESLVE